MAEYFGGLRERFKRWASGRRPKGSEITLNHKRIFIFPTAAGWFFLLLCIVMYLIAANYQNNLIYGTAFLLIALGVLTIHYTFFNLSGLKVGLVRTHHCFAGEHAKIQLQLSANNRRNYESVALSWRIDPATQEWISVQGEDGGEVVHYLPADERGMFPTAELRVETIYPFGLLRAWSWLELELDLLVYPKPLAAVAPESYFMDGEEGQVSLHGGDDFVGLDEYVPGTSPKHIAWKQYAQGRGLLKKNYQAHTASQQWLNWDDWREYDIEGRLSALCYWGLQLEQSGQEYGLKLPHKTVPPGSGSEHLNTILAHLASFPKQGELR